MKLYTANYTIMVWPDIGLWCYHYRQGKGVRHCSYNRQFNPTVLAFIDAQNNTDDVSIAPFIQLVLIV
jgi:hypothetical protein